MQDAASLRDGGIVFGDPTLLDPILAGILSRPGKRRLS